MTTEKDKSYWLSISLVLCVLTIVYNLVEGLISVYFGTSDDTLALLGFGLDSFVEVISGLGILHMVIRMKTEEVNRHDLFERQALRVTGFAFYLLAVGLIAGIILNIINDVEPSTTLPGIIIAIISLASMYFLMHNKIKTGKALNSEAILSDARCTLTCIYLSAILLVSSALYAWLKIQYIDLAGSLGIAWFAWTEGKEAFEKVRLNKITCSCDDCH